MQQQQQQQQCNTGKTFGIVDLQVCSDGIVQGRAGENHLSPFSQTPYPSLSWISNLPLLAVQSHSLRRRRRRHLRRRPCRRSPLGCRRPTMPHQQPHLYRRHRCLAAHREVRRPRPLLPRARAPRKAQEQSTISSAVETRNKFRQSFRHNVGEIFLIVFSRFPSFYDNGAPSHEINIISIQTVGILTFLPSLQDKECPSNDLWKCPRGRSLLRFEDERLFGLFFYARASKRVFSRFVV